MRTDSFESDIRRNWWRWRAAVLIIAIGVAIAGAESPRAQEQVFVGADAGTPRLQCGGHLASRMKDPDDPVAGASVQADPLCAPTEEQVSLGPAAENPRLQCGGHLANRMKDPDDPAAAASVQADPLCKVSPEIAALPPLGPCQIVNPQMTCEACLERFVQELDGLLAGKIHSVMDLNVLLNRTLPLKGCNVNEALKIAQKSKYFTSLFEMPDEYGISFSDAKEHPYSGSYAVSFSILKQSGNSDRPSTRVNK